MYLAPPGTVGIREREQTKQQRETSRREVISTLGISGHRSLKLMRHEEACAQHACAPMFSKIKRTTSDTLTACCAEVQRAIWKVGTHIHKHASNTLC